MKKTQTEQMEQVPEVEQLLWLRRVEQAWNELYAAMDSLTLCEKAVLIVLDDLRRRLEIVESAIDK